MNGAHTKRRAILCQPLDLGNVRLLQFPVAAPGLLMLLFFCLVFSLALFVNQAASFNQGSAFDVPEHSVKAL